MSDALRVLIVEDHPTWLEILSEILCDLGLAVETCRVLDEALQMISAKSHRLAVVDLSLQMENPDDKSGIRILDALREHDPDCKAILLSGFVTVGIAVKAIQEHGAYTCLQKETFQREEFIQAVNNALNLPPSRQINNVKQPPTGIRRNVSDEKADLDTKGSILVVDDDAGWRSILEELVTDSGYAATSCASYGEALSNLQRRTYDLVLLDLALQRNPNSIRNLDLHTREGVLLLEALTHSKTAVIVVSGETSPDEAKQLLEKYPISVFLEKRTFQRESAMNYIKEALNGDSDLALGGIVLTRRENELLDLIAKGYTNQQIADALSITLNTVKRHTKAIFRKLDIHHRAEVAARYKSRNFEKPG